MSLTISLVVCNFSIFAATMSEMARVLRFRGQLKPAVSRENALIEAGRYIELTALAEDPESVPAITDPDVLMAACHLIGQELDVEPARSLRSAVSLYRSVVRGCEQIGNFDERDYFVGETALLCGRASRFLGKRSEAEVWLDRAEAGFRNTVNPGPLLSRVSLQRLALRCDMGRYEEVAELTPMLRSTFVKYRMSREAIQCIYMEGTAQKQLGDLPSARASFELICNAEGPGREPLLTGMAFVALAEIHLNTGGDTEALAAYREAVRCLQPTNRSMFLASLKTSIGEMLLKQGQFEQAIEAYQAATADYERLEMATWVAYLRIELATAMIHAGKFREAEWQVISALPTIDAQKMSPQGVAAVALLAESTRRRKLDKAALADVRQHLRAAR
jgi:tetratricopeptide (TPR) repeat protein